jgi:hypothetical protein
MTRLRLPFAVFIGLVAMECGLLAFVDTTTRPLDRAGRPFQLTNIAAGTVITQRLEVGADGFDEIRLDGGITPGTGVAALGAELFEVDDRGTPTKMVRRSDVEIPPAATTCCLIRFAPIADSRWRMYRVDLTVRELNGRQLSLRAVPGPVNGRFAINGRFKTAFLVFSTRATQGTGLARLRSTAAGRSLLLVTLLLFSNGLIAVLVRLLVSASDPRHA